MIVIPVALYLFLYQRSRIEEATIRNFRALDDAAERVNQVLEHLTSVVNGSSFGVSPTMLDEVTERLTGERLTCGPEREAGPPDWSQRPEAPHDLLDSLRPTAAERLEFRYRLAAHDLFRQNEIDQEATRRLWNELHCLVDMHRRYSAPDEPIEVTVNPTPRIPLHPSGARCANMMSDAGCIRLRRLLAAEPCSESEPSPRLDATRNGMGAIVVDCRRLRERHRQLHDTLNDFTAPRP